MDGSYFGNNNHTACGGVFRDHIGRFFKAFSCNTGSCLITHAELWGIIRGLQIATTNDFSNIVF
ncbi:hypothetical protein AHAS_Ahas02G0093800 [Arachis hypogaea]